MHPTTPAGTAEPRFAVASNAGGSKLSIIHQMRTFIVLVMTLAAAARVSAQVSLELVSDQDQYLSNEAEPLAVKITNRSGQPLHLGATPDWLTFNVESTDNFIVIKNGDVPVLNPFDLESSQMGTLHVNLQPYFQMGRPGRYKITATLRIKEWGLIVNSAPIHFDVIHGAELWAQDFGVITPDKLAPEPRRFSLLKANYLKEQLRLYAEVSSAGGSQVLKVAELGPLVAFNSPEEMVDLRNRLHVLWQTGAQSFSYVMLNPDGEVLQRETYDNFNPRPHLSLDPSNGSISVAGGVRRPKPDELPTIKMPDAVMAPTPAPAVPAKK